MKNKNGDDKMKKIVKELTFENETAKEVGKFLEEVLVEDKYEEVSKLVLIEEEGKIKFYNTSEELFLIAEFDRRNYDWLGLQMYVQSICDYYDRNICQPKFVIYFEHP